MHTADLLTVAPTREGPTVTGPRRKGWTGRAKESTPKRPALSDGFHVKYSERTDGRDRKADRWLPGDQGGTGLSWPEGSHGVMETAER